MLLLSQPQSLRVQWSHNLFLKGPLSWKTTNPLADAFGVKFNKQACVFSYWGLKWRISLWFINHRNGSLPSNCTQPLHHHQIQLLSHRCASVHLTVLEGHVHIVCEWESPARASARDCIDESCPHTEADSWVETLQAEVTLSCALMTQWRLNRVWQLNLWLSPGQR